MSQSVSQLFRGPFPRSLHHLRAVRLRSDTTHHMLLLFNTSHFVDCQYDAPLARLRGTCTGKKIPGGAGTHTGHTRDTRAHKVTRITPTNLTTIQTHQHTQPARPATSARTATPIRRRRPKPRPTQQPQARSRPLPAVNSQKRPPPAIPGTPQESTVHVQLTSASKPRASGALGCRKPYHAHALGTRIMTVS